MIPAKPDGRCFLVWANIWEKGTIPGINLISKPIWKMLLKVSEVQEATHDI